MLSRVADNLYWMSRYLERAEHTARLVDVHLNLMLDQSPSGATQRWQRLLNCVRTVAPPGELSAYHITLRLTLDTANNNSVLACLSAARDNARNVREMISSEMWEHLNRMHWSVKEFTGHQVYFTNPQEFFGAVQEGARLFEGITDSTISHGEGWQFIQVGRFLERATAVANLLDIYFRGMAEPAQENGSGGPQPARLGASDRDDYLDWLSLLRSCSAFEAYCKVYTAHLEPERIAEFLLFNAEFPHSLAFSAGIIESSLNAIADSTGTRKVAKVKRLAGRLRADLNYGQVGEVMAGGLRSYLSDIQNECAQIHAALHQAFIAYPIAEELAA